MTDRPVPRRWLAPGAVGTAIVVASLVPLPASRGPLSAVPFGADAWLHAVGYAAFVASLLRALRGGEGAGSDLQRLALAATAGMALGAGVEVAQTAVPGRRFELADLVANAAGVAAGVAIDRLDRR